MQSTNAIVNSSSSGSAQASLFCTECYYKPGSCGNEPGSPVHHLGTPLPSSPPSGNLLEGMHATTPSDSLVRSIAQNHEEMKYLNLEVMNKSLRKPGDLVNSQPQSASLKHHDALATKDNIRAELQFV